jgi:acetyltransferase-like isoleucine patch superfamily enzyme
MNTAKRANGSVLSALFNSPCDYIMFGINIHYLLRRLVGKPTCDKHAQARLGSAARIINMGKSSSLISIGAHSIVDGDLLTFAHGGRITVGEWCYVGEGSRIWAAKQINIGDRVMISHNVNIFDSLTHPIASDLRHEHFRAIAITGHPEQIDLGERSVRIEDDAWIAAGAIVLRGVTIGKAAIIGAGSVVTDDVPPFAVAAGNPARVIRYLTAGERNRLDKVIHKN